MSDQQPPSSPGWVPPGQPQPPTAPWTPPPAHQPPTYTPPGGSQIPPPPPDYGQPSGPNPSWNAPAAPTAPQDPWAQPATQQQPAWQSQPPPGPQGPWQSQPPGGPQGPWQPTPPGGAKSKTPLILAGVGVVVVLALIGFFLASSGDDDKKKEATNGGSTTEVTTSTTEEESTTTTTEEEDPTTTTTTEVPSGEFEPPVATAGYQLYEDPAGEFAVTFPEDWTVSDGGDVGLSTASLVAIGPSVGGFATNLNLLTTPGGNDGEMPIDGESQSAALAGEESFQGLASEDISIGDKDGFVLTFVYDDGLGTRYDGYQYYVAGESDIYILTVAMPEGGDRTVADTIGESLRVA